MNQALINYSNFLIHPPKSKPHQFTPQLNVNRLIPRPFQILNHRNRLITSCSSPVPEIVTEEESVNSIDEIDAAFSEDDSIFNQMTEIVKFSGPAVGLWLCGPLMSLIDTAVVGQESSIELAALGPGTVLCDHTGYVFMFLSVATSNLVATALTRQDKGEVQHQVSILMFLGLACGVMMLVLTRLFGPWALSSFAGANNKEIISAANTYVQIRALAWPAGLFGWVAQSASLGMKDSWGPLKALAAASVINGVGDILLCRYFKFGIAGAAWATMVSQVVAGFMMVDALNKKGYSGYSLSIPSGSELMNVFTIAAPVFLTMMSKVLFYSLLVYVATSMGTRTIAAHQVMIQLYGMFAVFGEPLSQTAQSFMPERLYGVKRSLPKARMLLKSLVIIGASSGLILGSLGTSVPLFFPKLFSSDHQVIQEMHKVLLPFFLALCVTPSTHSLEGTLMAGRDLKFISLSMTGIFCLGALLLLTLTSRGCGLVGCWYTLVVFQWTRFLVGLRRLTLPTGVLYPEDSTRYQPSKLSTA